MELNKEQELRNYICIPDTKVQIVYLLLIPFYAGESNLWADDIAIIELKTEVTLNKYVSLACLPHKLVNHFPFKYLTSFS